MSIPTFTLEYQVEQSPKEVIAAFSDARAWWSENIKGRTTELGDEFDYAYRDVHTCRIRVSEIAPERTVVWHVLENHFDFVDDEHREWIGTDIRLDVEPLGDGGSAVRFSHVGLVPAYECFDVCSDAWTFYVKSSLRSLIATGQGQPTRGGEIDAALAARGEGHIPTDVRPA